MTKNDAHAKQTVRIYSADGEMIGTTYPKRARGLVRKGRAQFVNDCDIRLIVSDVTTFTEEIKMDKNISIDLAKDKAAEPVNRLYFDAREWSFNKDCQKNGSKDAYRMITGCFFRRSCVCDGVFRCLREGGRGFVVEIL